MHSTQLTCGQTLASGLTFAGESRHVTLSPAGCMAVARAQCAMSPGWAQCGMSPGRASCVTKQNHSTPFDVSACFVSVSFFWSGMRITGFSTALGSMCDVAGLGSMRDVAGLALLCCVWDAEPPFALPFLFPFPFRTFPLPKPSLFLLSPLSPYNPTAPWDRRKRRPLGAVGQMVTPKIF